MLELKRAWRKANPERWQAHNRAWWDANRERQYELNRAWRRAHPERMRELVRDWERRNPATRAGYSAQRRGWKGDSRVLERDWIRLCRRHRGRCVYCGDLATLTIDHVVPLSRGGKHAIGNILPACRLCNSAKQDRLLVEWEVGRAVERRRRLPVTRR